VGREVLLWVQFVPTTRQAMRLVLDETGYEYAFISVSGEVIDEGEVICV
jgi:hypothetical protein